MRRDEDKSISKKLIVYFIGLIMVASTFGVIFFGFSSGNRAVKYNDLKFYNKGNLWSVNVNGKEALFNYLPEEVRSLQVEENSIRMLKDIAQIDSTSQFNDTLAEPIALAQFQMGSTLNSFGIYLRSGFIGNISSISQIKCEDATSFVPVIYFKGSNQTKIYANSSCIIAEAVTAADMIKAKDRLVYEILGIILG